MPVTMTEEAREPMERLAILQEQWTDVGVVWAAEQGEREPQGGRETPTGVPIRLQELRSRLHELAGRDPYRKFNGLKGHILKQETLETAYRRSKRKDGAPGSDGQTFEDFEEDLEQNLSGIGEDLRAGRYRPDRPRLVHVPKLDGGFRKIHVPTIRDRIVQGALHLVLEPIFEADFRSGSYGYRPGRGAGDAVHAVRRMLLDGKVWGIDLDIAAYFDSIPHHRLLARVAHRVGDPWVLRLIKDLLKGRGRIGTPQGGVLSPLLANIYLDEVDGALESLPGEKLAYVRYADDLVVLLEPDRGLRDRTWGMLTGKLGELGLAVNARKTRPQMDLRREPLAYLGFQISLRGSDVEVKPQVAAITRLSRKLEALLAEGPDAHAEDEIIRKIHQVVRGWVAYYRIGDLTGTRRLLERCLGRSLRQAWKRRPRRARQVVQALEDLP